MNKKGWNFTLSGFIIAMILIAMFGTVFAGMITQMNSEYSKTGNNSFSKYEAYTSALENKTQDIRNSTDIQQEDGWLDVVGGYFSAGYSALGTAKTSINLFDEMMDDAAEDVPEFSLFKTYIWMIIVIALIIGVVIAVLLKMRI